MRGKSVGGYNYVHITLLSLLKERFSHINFNTLLNYDFNVIKYSLRGETFSFLEYKEFLESEFPELVCSTLVTDTNDFSSNKLRNYSLSNPPILHRKELLLPPDHPDIPKFAALTKQLEEAGLFKESRKSATKNNGKSVCSTQATRLSITSF